MINQVFTVRGATTLTENSVKEIQNKTIELIKEIIKVNNLNDENYNVVNIMASTTEDITAFYPVRAIRESGISDAPLFSCIEPNIDGGLKLCVRLMLTVSSEAQNKVTAKHIYLHGAAALRKDLVNDLSEAASVVKNVKNIIVAIDGPAGAGKSTIAKLLAKMLDFVYLDTGAMYRAIALKLSRDGIFFDDISAVENVLESTAIEVAYVSGSQKIFCDGEDVSEAIREHKISKLASDVSALKCVRLKMVELQRYLASKNNTILDGRDIGTFVLPSADFKFYLTASIEERANRRYKELNEKGAPCEYEVVKADIAQRDFNDAHREFAPLKKAEDAIEVNTTGLSIDEVCEKMLKIIKL